MPKKGGNEMLSLKQAAEIAGYDVGSLRHLAIDGKFPAQKIGNQWAIVRADLDRWMDSESYHPGQKGRPSKKR